jgi:inorganic pyrophosphatase
MPKHFISELRNYFEQYKVLENKEVQIEEFQSKEAAYTIIRESIQLYKQKFA